MPLDLTPKFSIGERVYSARTVTTRKQHPCPDCGGSRKWAAKSPAGREYEFSCPRCSAQYSSNDALNLNYTQHVGSVLPLTIGSIRVDTHDEHPVSYMCRETGVGGGQIHYEEHLFRTEAEARDAADAMALASNANTDWIVKQYDKTLSLSDYQMGDAALKAAKEVQTKISVRFGYLVSDLRDCENMGEVRDVLDRFEQKQEAA